ncbi:hypothetical protein L596_027493 [Steinernema carpocapsae]|uniref:RRM domain-containing protein n=1 Tax=Steinernema carpocapsae TaxID=34508 RepID=A0A4U5LVM5_STECR|nr:hypothetical protein L596_027493 [Steinernema carpocapsae]
MRLTNVSFVRSVAKTGKEILGKDRQIFVHELSWHTGRKQVMQHFSKFGEVESCTIPLNLDQGLHKGYAFVQFKSKASVANVLNAGSQQQLEDKAVKIRAMQ